MAAQRPRISKPTDERRAEIVECARRLFAERGFLLIGSLLLANPEIQAFNTVASVLLAIGFLGYAWTYLKPQTSSS